MKRIISLFSVLIILLSVNTVAFGAGSPVGEKLYKISISSNRIDSDIGDNYFEVVTAGEEISLAAEKDTDVSEFDKWSINGEYDLISGKLTSKEITIKPLGDLKVFQIFNNTYTITIKTNLKNDINVYTQMVKSNEEVQLLAEMFDNRKFEKWIIKGEYDIVSGNLTDTALYIIPKSDLIIIKSYSNEVVKHEEKEDENKKKYSDNQVIMIVIGLCVLIVSINGFIVLTYFNRKDKIKKNNIDKK